MNYIILNGRKSNEINGLMIQELPAVSKPLKRTEISTYDGRDGDVITELGYSAYDKELSIGLFGNFNIDQVIRYFDSEGTVIFSNEPDKYYRYKIVEQIDFERLVRFRTATITFHVQPFKYSAVEEGKRRVITNQLFDALSYAEMKNGITVASNGNMFTLNGTASADTEFYIPLKRFVAHAGQWIIKCISSGTNSQYVAMSIVKENANDALGGTLLNVTANKTVSIKTAQAESIACSTLYIYIPSGTTLASQFTMAVESWFAEIINMGNTFSKPVLKLTGDGLVKLNVNDGTAFNVDMSTYHTVVLDTDAMDAYYESMLLNRCVSGDYDDLRLRLGNNILAWDGDVSQIEISDFSRWI